MRKNLKLQLSPGLVTSYDIQETAWVYSETQHTHIYLLTYFPRTQAESGCQCSALKAADTWSRGRRFSTKRADNLPSYPPDKHHISDLVKICATEAAQHSDIRRHVSTMLLTDLLTYRRLMGRGGESHRQLEKIQRNLCRPEGEEQECPRDNPCQSSTLELSSC